MELKFLKKIKPQYFVMILGFGILLMIISNALLSGNGHNNTSLNADSENFYRSRENIEKDLADIIEKIAGVECCDVFITYENNGVKKHVTDIKEDTINSKESLTTKRELNVVTEKKSGMETPYVSEEIMPQIRGVLIVAKNAENIKIKDQIATAISAVLGVSLHKVQILPAK